MNLHEITTRQKDVVVRMARNDTDEPCGPYCLGNRTARTHHECFRRQGLRVYYCLCDNETCPCDHGVKRIGQLREIYVYYDRLYGGQAVADQTQKCLECRNS